MATAKDKLEQEKIAAETRQALALAAKAQAEADKATFDLEYQKRDDLDTLAHDDFHHVYPFMGAVSAESARSCIARLSKWSRRDPGCDITLVFNSPGGSVIDGLALYDCISELRAKGHHVTTVARGYAASMGGILLQAGDKRVIGANAHVLVHEISSGAIGKVSEIEDHQAFTKMLAERLLSILAERSTMTAKQIANKWSRRDWWINADECVQLGLADEIG